MKRKKTLIILSGALVVLLGATVATNTITKHIDSINTIDEEVLAVKADEVTSINVEKAGYSLTLTKDEDSWKDKTDDAFPIDTDKISDFLNHFSSVHASFIIDDVEDYSQYGLKNPEATVSFTTDEGETRLSLGSFSTMDSKRYISVEDGKVYLIDEDLMDYISTDRDDYMNADTAPAFSQVRECTISGQNDLKLVYDESSHSYTDYYKYYQVDGDSYRVLSSTLVNSYLNTILQGSFSDYVTYTATEDSLKDYGFDQPDTTIVITGDVSLSEEDDSTESQSVTVAVASKEDKHYLHFEGSSIVYNLDDDSYKLLTEGSYETLRPSELVYLDWEKVTALEGQVDGKDYKVSLTHEKDDDGNDTGKIGENEFSIAELETAIDSLALSEASEKVKAGDKEWSFTIYLDNDTYKTIEIAMYRYDGNDCVVEVDGQIAGLMNRDKMNSVKEAFTSVILNANN